MWQCAINVCHWPQSICPGGSGAHHSLDWRGPAWLIEMRVWLIEVRGLANRREGLANRSEGLGGRTGPGPVDQSGDWRVGLAQAVSLKVMAWRAERERRGRAGLRPVDKSKGLGGQARPGPKKS